MKPSPIGVLGQNQGRTKFSINLQKEFNPLWAHGPPPPPAAYEAYHKKGGGDDYGRGDPPPIIPPYDPSEGFKFRTAYDKQEQQAFNPQYQKNSCTREEYGGKHSHIQDDPYNSLSFYNSYTNIE